MDGGVTWESVLDQGAITLAEIDGTVYAGLADGQIAAIHPVKADALRPPLNDLGFLLVAEQRPLVIGMQSGLWIWSNRQGWKTPGGLPELVTALEAAPDGGLVLAGPEGIYRSTNQGQSWETVYTSDEEIPTLLTFRANGWGWAGSASGSQVLRTKNHGRTWEPIDAPFGSSLPGAPVSGANPLVALQAAPELVIAATYNSRLEIAQLWYSQDDGETWKRGAQVKTSWAIIATSSHPPVFSLGGVLFILRPNSTWVRLNTLNRGGVLRLAGNNHILYALTAGGLVSSLDQGENWADVPDCPAVNEILNIAIEKDTLYLLLAGGKVWSRPVEQ